MDATRDPVALSGDKLTAAKAAAHLGALVQGMQLMRSATAEELHMNTDPAMAKIVADLLPWLMGDKGSTMLSKIAEILDAHETTGEIPGSAFFNLVLVVNRLQPQLRIAMEVFAGYRDFPTAVSPTLAFETLR